MKLLGISLMLLAATLVSGADDLVIQSGPARVHLLELFTSEGCNSCPPAEASFARQTAREKLWSRLVPVAWHVDYWDYLGWRDRFATPANSDRERAYAGAWHSRSVYTPCFALDGREWHSNTDTPAEDTPGVLEARLKGNDLEVKFTPRTRLEKTREAWVALLSGEETSHVTAGENAGQDLKHLFVVRTAFHQNMTHSDAMWTASFKVPKKEVTAAALAVWVSGGIPDVEQALGGWLRKH